MRMDFSRLLGLVFMIILLTGAVMVLGPQAQAQNAEGVRLQMDVDKSGMRLKRGFLLFVYPFSSVHANLKE